MERITKATLEARVANVNRRLERTGRYVVTQARNGYIGLDEYAHEWECGETFHTDECIRTITVGTKREIAEFLHAMMVGIDLYRYSEEA